MMENRKSFIYSILLCFISGIIFGCFYLFNIQHIVVAYDEIAMKMIAAGELSNKCEPYMIFHNIGIGFLVSGLYKIVNWIEWYEVLLLFCLFFAMFAFLYRINQFVIHLNKKVYIAVVAFSFLFFVFMFYESFVLLRFTYCATITGVVFLFFYFSKCKLDYVDYCISLVLLLLCFSIREDIFKMILPYLCIFLAFKLIRGDFDKVELGYWIIVITCILGLFLGDRFAYQEEWKNAKEINGIRASMQDYGCVPEFESNLDVYEDLELSYWDYYVLRMTYWGLSDHLNLETLTALNSVNIEKNTSLKNESLSEQIQFFNAHKSDISILILLADLLLVVCNIYLLLKDGSKLSWLLYCGILFLWVVEWWYLIYGGNLPYRVSYSMHVLFCFCNVTNALLICQRSEKITSFYVLFKKKTGFIFFIGFVMLFFCLMLVRIYKVCISNEQNYETNKSFYALEKYMEENEDKSYICFVNEYCDELDIINQQKNNYTKMTGWIGETPSWQSFLKGDYSTKVEALANRTDLYFVTVENDESPLFLEDYLEEKGYNVKYDYEIVSFEGIKYWIWSLVN